MEEKRLQCTIHFKAMIMQGQPTEKRGMRVERPQITAQTKVALKKNTETKNEGRQRLLFRRPTMDKSTPVMHEMNPKKIKKHIVSPQSIKPGKVPKRPGGKKPKNFFALFKSFTGGIE